MCASAVIAQWLSCLMDCHSDGDNPLVRLEKLSLFMDEVITDIGDWSEGADFRLLSGLKIIQNIVSNLICELKEAQTAA